MTDKDMTDFERRFRQRFDNSVTGLDGSTLSRITTARNRVLDSVVAPVKDRFLWAPAGAIAAICTAILFFSLVPQEKAEDETFIDEIDIITELDLYENLDFYEWLEQHELPT